MTQPQDPRKHPLQDDEVALARVLRALPSGEPPASVDDAILRAATDAVSPGRRKPARGLRWLPTWAIGTAAAAVLAVGIGVQLRPPLAPPSPTAGAQQKAPVRPDATERLDIELVEPEQAPAPPPASAPPEPGRSTGRPPPPPPPAPPAAPPPPAPVVAPAPQALPAEAAMPALADEASPESDGTLDSIVVSGTRVRTEATDQARRAHQETYARRAQAKASERAAMSEEEAAKASVTPGANLAPPPASAAAPAPPAAGAQATNAMAESAAASAILPPVADDARLAPDDWIERIRERRRQGDMAGARASLRLFVLTHPAAPVPTDLARLR